MADINARSWFCVFNNPDKHGYEGTPQEICERLRDEWIKDNPLRTGAWVYCISAEGLHHVHMVLEDEKTMRFSAVKKSYCAGMHFEPTKGNKKQAEDYIYKRGSFEEKGEQILYTCVHGEIKGRQGSRSDLVQGYDMIMEGLTPYQILRMNPNLYRYKTAIKDMYYDKRSSETPIVRDMKVYWHTGLTGSGKSFERVNLAQEVGEENIYYLTTFGSGAFDNYNGQQYLWIDDYRGEFKFQELLRLLDVYKAEVPARYTNVTALWNEVHITSVLTPQQCYANACSDDTDRIDQLLRRITAVVYHFRMNDEFCSLSFSPYELRNNMETSVMQYRNTFKDFERIY